MSEEATNSDTLTEMIVFYKDEVDRHLAIGLAYEYISIPNEEQLQFATYALELLQDEIDRIKGRLNEKDSLKENEMG
jgi:hypothetical protein